MTTKEKIIRQSIESVVEKIKELDSLLFANPLGDICRLRIQIGELIKTENDNSVILQEFKKATIEEKRLFKIAEKQRDTTKLIDEKVKLYFELRDLERELYYIKNV